MMRAKIASFRYDYVSVSQCDGLVTPNPGNADERGRLRRGLFRVTRLGAEPFGLIGAHASRRLPGTRI
jgi:hypothetical protein